jgi:hypothetical protein
VVSSFPLELDWAKLLGDLWCGVVTGGSEVIKICKKGKGLSLDPKFLKLQRSDDEIHTTISSNIQQDLEFNFCTLKHNL